MSIFRKFSHPNGDETFISTTQFDDENNEDIFCTEDNLKESLCELSEELSSLGITPITLDNDDDLQSAEKQPFIQIINSTWDLVHKHRSFMRLYDKTVLLNHKTYNNNIHFKNQVTRLQEDLEKKEQALHDAQTRENKLKYHLDNASRDLKREKEEARKLGKQVQSKNIQHEHEMKRILQINQKLQEQLRKSIGTFIPRDKALQKIQTDQEKELASYKRTVSRLEENNRQMLEEINDLKEALALHKGAIDLQIEASGAWIDVEK
ncbi:afadin- and alpha-actinin-binding protein [Harpegnathos saltator]|uniref:Afadin-and alpha-actinin-binding protein n=1 Tax=Harpegnathos saltator TaxID=610380 RepID=E2BYG9_HARSA|nr:afadin- and alpha-actinin-binding protein [Harpegnathos saltator]EFN79253.1 hypothetical protein EAI_08922 [Harpegnathos saltator]